MKDITGRKYGELTVIGFDRWHKHPSGLKSARWMCRCSCGTEKSIIYGNLVKNTSCGCKMRGVGKSRNHDKGSWINYLLNSYITTCNHKGREFSLTLDEVEIIAKSNCHYCGCEPVLRKVRQAFEYYANGIDRKDSSKGYTMDNCVSCCPVCNQMKMDMPYDEFLAQVRRINERHC